MTVLGRVRPGDKSGQAVVIEPSQGVVRLIKRLANRAQSVRRVMRARAKAALVTKTRPITGDFAPAPQFQSWRPTRLKGAAARAAKRKSRQVMRRESRRANR